MEDRATAAAASLLTASFRWCQSPKLLSLMANSGGGAFASSNNNAVTAAAAAAATSSSSGYSSNILEPLSAPVPGAVLSSDMARIESVVYPWKGAPGAAEHSGLVTLHAALEVSSCLHTTDCSFVFKFDIR